MAAVLLFHCSRLAARYTILFHESIEAYVNLSNLLVLRENLVVFNSNFLLLLFDCTLFLLDHSIHLSKLFFLPFKLLSKFCFLVSHLFPSLFRSFSIILERFLELPFRFLLFFVALHCLHILIETAALIFSFADEHSFKGLINRRARLFGRLDVCVNPSRILRLNYFSTLCHLKKFLKHLFWCVTSFVGFLHNYELFYYLKLMRCGVLGF